MLAVRLRIGLVSGWGSVGLSWGLLGGFGVDRVSVSSWTDCVEFCYIFEPMSSISRFLYFLFTEIETELNRYSKKYKQLNTQTLPFPIPSPHPSSPSLNLHLLHMLMMIPPSQRLHLDLPTPSQPLKITIPPPLDTQNKEKYQIEEYENNIAVLCLIGYWEIVVLGPCYECYGSEGLGNGGWVRRRLCRRGRLAREILGSCAFGILWVVEVDCD